MPPDFTTAAVPEIFTILRRELKPLAIGHILFLRRFDCDPVITADQLLLAIIICSNPWEEILPTLRDFALPLKLRLWRWQVRRFEAQEKIKLFHEYIAAHTQRGPSVLEQEHSGAVPGAPWLQHVRVTLMSKLGYTISQSMNVSYDQCLWDYYTHFENEGRADIAGEHHAAMRALANEMHEETLRQANQGFAI